MLIHALYTRETMNYRGSLQNRRIQRRVTTKQKTTRLAPFIKATRVLQWTRWSAHRGKNRTMLGVQIGMRNRRPGPGTWRITSSLFTSPERLRARRMDTLIRSECCGTKSCVMRQKARLYIPTRLISSWAEGKRIREARYCLNALHGRSQTRQDGRGFANFVCPGERLHSPPLRRLAGIEREYPELVPNTLHGRAYWLVRRCYNIFSTGRKQQKQNFEIAHEDQDKKAFTSQHGIFSFTRMPSGLKNSSNIFRRAMNVLHMID